MSTNATRVLFWSDLSVTGTLGKPPEYFATVIKLHTICTVVEGRRRIEGQETVGQRPEGQDCWPYCVRKL